MDARKAFDVVWHTGLFRDLYTFGITDDNWLFFKTLVPQRRLKN
jgi:hypothetical protein